MMTVERADLCVADLMTLDPISVAIDASIEEAEAVMRDFRVTGLPVVDRDGRLVGVISETDLLYLALPSVRAMIQHRDPKVRVGEIMSTPPVTVDGSAPLGDAARLMAHMRVHRLVVVNDRGSPSGVLSAMDFVSLAADREH